MYIRMRSDLALLVILLTTFLAGVKCQDPDPEIFCNSSECDTSYITLVTCLMSNSENAFNLSKAFLPPTKQTPVFVRVNYNTPSGDNRTWFWTKHTSSLLHPLEVFQFFSLLFSNYDWRAGTVDVTLPDECLAASKDHMELLTQRLKVHATTQSITPTFTDGDDANSANLTTLIDLYRDEAQGLVTVLYLYHILLPPAMYLIAFGVLWSKKDQISKSLPRDKTDQESFVAGIKAVSVLIAAYVLILNAVGIFYANKKVEKDSAQYFSCSTGSSNLTAIYILPQLLIIFDGIALFILVAGSIYTLIRKNICKEEEKPVYSVIICIVSVVAILSNHSYFVVISFTNDPVHANSIGIYYTITVIFYLFGFKQLHKVDFVTETNWLSRKFVNFLNTDSEDNKKRVLRGITLFINVGLKIVLAVICVASQFLVTATFVYLPIKRTVEDIPTQFNAIYHSLIIVFTALITYKVFYKNDDTLDSILKKGLIEFARSKQNNRRQLEGSSTTSSNTASPPIASGEGNRSSTASELDNSNRRSNIDTESRGGSSTATPSPTRHSGSGRDSSNDETMPLLALGSNRHNDYGLDGLNTPPAGRSEHAKSLVRTSTTDPQERDDNTLAIEGVQDFLMANEKLNHLMLILKQGLIEFAKSKHHDEEQQSASQSPPTSAQAHTPEATPWPQVETSVQAQGTTNPQACDDTLAIESVRDVLMAIEQLKLLIAREL